VIEYFMFASKAFLHNFHLFVNISSDFFDKIKKGAFF